MAGFSRSSLVVMGVFLLAADALAGQSRAAGRIVRVAAGDTMAIPGIAVVLHRVGRATQGPIDTVEADRAGKFRFRFSGDTASAFLLSARYGGIEYFSQPIATNPATPDTAVVLVVADTSSGAPVVLRQRTLLIGLADETGSRTVLDWFVVSNPGERTRVSPDSLHPSWGTLLPPEAQDVELADSRLSQFAPDALSFRRDSLLVLAPISPGDKELMLQYRIPGTLRRFDLPSGGVTDSVFLLIEGGKGKPETSGFVSRDSQTIEGRVFQRWAGVAQRPGDILVSLSAPLLSTGQILGLLAGLAALGFVALGARLARRRPVSSPAPAPPSPLGLADAAARLDASYAGREVETPPDEWNRYLEERARLKAELERAIAAGRHHF